jgi:hypothetical protein
MHQNVTGFKHNPNSKVTRKILSIPNFGLCGKCHDVIEWRKKYRKYKPLKDPSKCQYCKERKVVYAYHQICQDCAQERDVCSKCLKHEELTARYCRVFGVFRFFNWFGFFVLVELRLMPHLMKLIDNCLQE